MPKISKPAPPPKERCDECKAFKPRFGFVTVTQEGGISCNMCPSCYNRDQLGLDIAEFEPITRFDWQGKAHIFHFAVLMTTGLGIKACEWFEDGPGGYTFGVLEHPETPVRDAYDKLVRKIEAGLAEGYVEVSDYPGVGPSGNRLYIRGRAVNGRIEGEELDPAVVVDGREYTWVEFGRMLCPYVGFNFRLECYDLSDEPEITANPKRPNTLWWLDLPERDEEKDRGHH